MRVTLFFILSLFLLPAFGQPRFIVRGKVVTAEDGKPLAGVSVRSETTNTNWFSDEAGEFRLEGHAGSISLSFTSVGRKEARQAFELRRDTTLYIVLSSLSLSLDEIVVVARQRKVGSSSILDKTAIRHTQPTSLADVLQLIPGQLSLNPDLSGAQQINLRQVPSNSDAARATALGTAIVLDGIPFSNNANLQTNVTILNSSPGTLPPFSSVAGRGNDLRQIPADQIEQVEVIRGIPSSRYGDLTSGAILVTTRAGAFKPVVTTRLNPNLSEFAAGFGFKAGRHTFTSDNDLTFAQDDPRNTLSRYTRFTSQLTWSRPWGQNLSTTTRIAVFSTLDENKEDPDDRRYQRKIYSRDQGFRLSSNGQLNAGSGLFSSFLYDAGVTYSDQRSYVQELITRDLFPVTDATTPGTRAGRYGESEYLSKVTTSGKPLSLYARLEGTIFRSKVAPAGQDRLSNRVLVGGEYRHDGNSGDGRQFDPSRPPRQNYSAGDRPRSYADIPSINQISYYLEDRFSTPVAGRTLDLQAGLRLDNIQPLNPLKGAFGNVLAPRINLAFETLKNLRLKAGYGVTSKAPTLSFLYPGNRYFDLVNFNYYATNPAERLVVLSTVVFDTKNETLKSYKSRKAEVGIDFGQRGFYGYVTAFHELSRGAYGTNREVTVVAVAKYQASSFPAGRPPILNPVPSRLDPFYAAYDVTANNRRIENTGVEFQFDTPRLSGLNTSLNVTGAYIVTRSFDDGNAADANRAVFSNVTPARVAIYRSGFGNEGERFNTSIRFDTRIPRFAFLVSGLVQTIWTSSTRNLDLSPYAVGYIDNQGNTVYLAEPESAQVTYSDLRRAIDPSLTRRDKAPALWLLNVRLAKEFKNRNSLAFYVNNVPADRGRYFNEATQSYTHRNQELFFGAEFTISL